MKRIVPSVVALLLFALLASSRVAVAASQSTCVNGGQQNPDIAAGKSALQRSPTRLGKRMELANLLEKAGCYDEAVHLLEEGQKYNPFNLGSCGSICDAPAIWSGKNALARASRPRKPTSEQPNSRPITPPTPASCKPCRRGTRSQPRWLPSAQTRKPWWRRKTSQMWRRLLRSN